MNRAENPFGSSPEHQKDPSEGASENLNTKKEFQEMQEALAEFGVYHSDGSSSAEALLDAHVRTLQNYEALIDIAEEDDLEEVKAELAKYPKEATGSPARQRVITTSREILERIVLGMEDTIRSDQAAQDIRDTL